MCSCTSSYAVFMKLLIIILGNKIFELNLILSNGMTGVYFILQKIVFWRKFQVWKSSHSVPG